MTATTTDSPPLRSPPTTPAPQGSQPCASPCAKSRTQATGVVGGMTFKQGTSQVSQAVYASPADVEAFKEIDSRGIKQYIQQVPSTASSDLMGALKDKGLL